MLEVIPGLEHLYLHQDFAPGKPRAIVLRESAKLEHPKTLSLWRFAVQEIIALFHSVTLPKQGLAVRFVDVRSEDLIFARIYPLDIPPHLSIFSATPRDSDQATFLRLPRDGGRLYHRRTVAFQRSVSLDLRGDGHVAQGPFDRVRELRMPVHPGSVNVPLEFPALELLVLGREDFPALGFSKMLAPQEGEVPSPRIKTIEIRGCVDLVIVAEFATVFHDRAKAGYRLKLRMKGRETSLVPLEHEVDELELLDELGGGMELPEICETDIGERWLSWRRDPCSLLRRFSCMLAGNNRVCSSRMVGTVGLLVSFQICVCPGAVHSRRMLSIDSSFLHIGHSPLCLSPGCSGFPYYVCVVHSFIEVIMYVS